MNTHNAGMNIRLSNILANAKSVIRKDGLTSLCKQFISLLFLHEDCLIFRKYLDTVDEVKPKIENCVLKIISSKSELLDLVKHGFDITGYFNLYELQRKLDQGEILFAVFIDGQLVHKTCVLMYNTGTMDAPISIDWNEEAYAQFVETIPKYRGYHIYPYTLSNVFRYLNEKGKSACVSTSTKKNLSSINAHLGAGYKICGNGRYIRVLIFFEFWKETLKQYTK